VLPTLLSYRIDVSLYSEQYDSSTGKKIPIPDSIIQKVIAALLRFKVICADLNVRDHNIRVLATEATRTAINSLDFLKKIKKASGLDVELLPKEEEGLVGALGIASGFSEVQGLVMDLGGGSAQITWMISRAGEVKLSDIGSRSFPYGAAALTRKLEELRSGKSTEEGDIAVARFREEVKENFVKAYQDLKIPKEMVERAKTNGGFPFYLSGGGFRGWGFILLYLSQVHGQHYPISLINGFSASKAQFEDTETIKRVARTAQKIFRVSDRRREQVPAVAFLISALSESIPHGIKEVHFCQGGVREGALFRQLPPDIRKQDPLEVGTEQFARQSANQISDLILAAIPARGKRELPESISVHDIHAYGNILYAHASMSKESASTAALYSTSTGLMSGTHGISHSDRALLALMLERRYEGELPPREVDFKLSLQKIVGPEVCWWTQYLGAVGLLISKVYPAGIIDEKRPRIKIAAQWASGFGNSGDKEGLRLIFYLKKIKNDPMMLKESLEDHSDDIKKVGKSKNWIGGETGWGMAIDIKIKEVDEL
jgi:retrograde regulation protein 2